MKTRSWLLPFALIVVVIAAVTGFSYPRLTKAMERSREKRAMADLRAIATAWEARWEDTKSYDVGRAAPSTFDMKRALVPKYIRNFPAIDPWGRSYHFEAAPGRYTIRTDGPNRLIAKDDIIYSNGSFVQYPENGL